MSGEQGDREGRPYISGANYANDELPGDREGRPYISGSNYSKVEGILSIYLLLTSTPANCSSTFKTDV